MEEQLFSIEDATAGRVSPTTEPARPAPAATESGEGYRPSFETPEKTYSLSQAQGVKEEGERKLLDRAPDEGWFSSAGKSAATSAIKGGAELPVTGMFGSLRELADLGVGYAASQVSGRPFEDVMASKKKLSEAFAKPSETPLGRLEQKLDILRLPSGAELSEPVLKKTGEYKPSSEAGKIGQAGLTAAISGLSPSGKAGAAEKALDIARKSSLIGAGGAAADVTARYTGSIPLALAAGALTPTALNVVPTIARAHLGAKGLGKDVAGQAIREGARDEQAALTALEGKQKLLPGVELTSAQKAADPGLSAMERRLAGEKRLAPEGAQSLNVSEQIARSEEAVTKGAQTAATKLQRDMDAAYGLTGSAPREVASEQARSIFSSLEKSADDAVKNLWKDKALESATMYTQKTIGQLDDYIAKLSPTERNAIPDVILKTVKELKETPGSQIPIDYVQKLRSDLLAKGRAAYANQDDTVGAINYRLAEELKGALSDSANFSFGGMRGGTSVPKAWQDAVDATRQYHETFNTGFLKKLNQQSEAGVNKIPLDATFRAMATDKKMGAQNLEQLQNATGGKINPAFSDFMVAELTNNGTKIVKPSQVDDFIGKNALLIDKTPGLKDRLNSIKTAGESNQLSATILKNMDDPQGLVDVFKGNRAEIAQLTKNSPKDRAYFRLLEQSANRINKLPESQGIPMKTLDKLAEGRTSDILYGIATGRIASGLVGVGAAKLATIDQMTGSPMFMLLSGAAAGNMGRAASSTVNSVIDTVLSGSVRQRAIEILHDARTNPALMAELMKRPSPQKVGDLFTVRSTASAATPVSEGVQEYESRGARATGGRVEFASGGHVSQGVEAGANALMQAAETSKKALGRQTEALLNHDDNTIARALEVANEAI